MSSYRASSGDALRSFTPCLSAELCAVVWQEPGCPHMSAICLRCTSSARRLSSICRQAIINGMDVVGNLADDWLHFQREGCLNT
jgi:hypothetical protein